MPTLQQIRQNAFVPYGTAGFASANNAAALPGPDLPPSGYPNFNYGGQTYGQGGNVSINDPSPGAGYNPNSGWTGRLPRYAAGGLPGLAIGGGVELYKRLFNHNTGNPGSNMVGSGGRGQGSYGPPNSTPPSDTPPGMGGGSLGQPIGTRYGLPDYGTNPANYPTDWSYGGPQSGPGAPHRGDIVGYRGNEPVYQGGRVSTDTRLSGAGYDAASRAQNAQEASFQASGGYNTGSMLGDVQDAGHVAFGAQSRTHGVMSDGVVEIQPGGIYDTVFAGGMGANNPNRYRNGTAAALYQNPPASVGQSAPPLTAPTNPPPIGIGGTPGPFVGPLPRPAPPIAIGGTPGPFVGPLPYPYNRPPGFYGGPIRGK